MGIYRTDRPRSFPWPGGAISPAGTVERKQEARQRRDPGYRSDVREIEMGQRINPGDVIGVNDDCPAFIRCKSAANEVCRNRCARP